MNILVTAALTLALAGSAQAQALRDPFARPAPQPVATGSAAPEAIETPPRLRAIMYTPGRSLANINGQILAVGEWFGDYRLINIQERSVTLARRGVRTVLGLDEARDK